MDLLKTYTVATLMIPLVSMRAGGSISMIWGQKPGSFFRQTQNALKQPPEGIDDNVGARLGGVVDFDNERSKRLILDIFGSSC